MQTCVQQKLSGSSFVDAYLSSIPLRFDSIRLTIIDTQILRWRGFDAHVPACFWSNVFLELSTYSLLLNNAKNFSLTFSKNGRLSH